MDQGSCRTINGGSRSCGGRCMQWSTPRNSAWTSTTIDRTLDSDDPDVRRFVGKRMVRSDARSRRGLGLPDRQAGRQLRGERRTQHRATRGRARRQPAVEGRRRRVRAATAVISTTRTPAPVSPERLASGAMFEHGQSSGRSWRSPVRQRSSRQLPSRPRPTSARAASRRDSTFSAAAGFEIAGAPSNSRRGTPTLAPSSSACSTRFAVSLTGIVIATALGVAGHRATLERVGRRHRRTLLPRSDSEHLLLVQLLFWYALTQELPGPSEALNPLPVCSSASAGGSFRA